MKLQLLLIFVFLSNTAIALNPFIAKYKLSISGVPIATETRVLNQFGSDYIYTANAKTSGLINLLGDISIEARSLFSINNNGIDAQSYLINENKDGKLTKSYAVNISSKNNMSFSTTTLSTTKATVFKSKGGNIVDPLSLFLALSHDLQKNTNQTLYTYQVADGKSIKLQQYKISSNEILNINGSPTKVIKISKTGDSNENIKAFFSPKHQYLPVLIEKSKGNKNYSYRMIELKINQNPVKNLKVIL